MNDNVERETQANKALIQEYYRELEGATPNTVDAFSVAILAVISTGMGCTPLVSRPVPKVWQRLFGNRF